MTQQEMQRLLDQINNNFKKHFDRLDQLEQEVKGLGVKVEELSNAKVQGPKTSTGRGKRVQQTKTDAKSSD